MASLFLTHPLPLFRWHANCSSLSSPFFVQLQDFRLQTKCGLRAVSKKNIAESIVEDESNDDVAIKKATKTSKQAPKRGRKKAIKESPEENPVTTLIDGAQEESTIPSESSEDPKKAPRKTRKKATPAPSISEGEKMEEKVNKRKTRKKIDNMEEKGSETEVSDNDWTTSIENVEDEKEEDLEFVKDGEEDISFTYSWPPLVCCFGAAQHAFVPSGRPANRLIDYEIHDRMKDARWAPTKFVRAPGGCSSSVAVALATLGGRVAFMGKLGDDDYGQTMLYYLNKSNVQTRSVCLDSKRPTAVSHMKIGRRGGLRMTCTKPCAEDSLSRSEINIDVLKETKMFYFNSSSLLNQDMRSTTLQAIKISKKLGGVIFFDINLPLPLWQSSEDTKMFIWKAWNLADIIEVTKQELEFLCGIKPSENFDTRNNHKSKFIHYSPGVITPLWHENLKVLFVTNGTSKIHYYTENHNGFVHGMEDAPITPFTCDMSASGDGIVAALMRMLTVQPHLITDKGYLERTIKYAIDCGVIDQWKLARTCGFPPKEELKEEVTPDINGIRSITETEYRTVKEVEEELTSDPNGISTKRVYRILDNVDWSNTNIGENPMPRRQKPSTRFVQQG